MSGIDYKANHHAHVARGIPTTKSNRGGRFTYCVAQCVHNHAGPYCGYRLPVEVDALEWERNQQLIRQLTEALEQAATTLEAGSDGIGDDWNARDAAEVVRATIRETQAEQPVESEGE